MRATRAPGDIHALTAAELSAAFAARSLSPREVAAALLARIEKLDGAIIAFCFLDPDETLRQARASERRWMENAPLSPLDGVPVAIKDILLTRGWPTLRGSRTVDADGPWEIDAPAVARLRAARRAARPRRSPRASRRWRSAPTAAARSASRRISPAPSA